MSRRQRLKDAALNRALDLLASERALRAARSASALTAGVQAWVRQKAADRLAELGVVTRVDLVTLESELARLADAVERLARSAASEHPIDRHGPSTGGEGKPDAPA